MDRQPGAQWQFHSGSGRYDINNTQTYLTWCAQANANLDFANGGPIIYVENTALFTLYNTYPNSALLPTDRSPNWPQVNYILNHKNGKSVADIQEAIWYLLDGAYHSNNIIGPFNGSPGTTALLNDAAAHGQSFVPGPGQIVAVLLEGDPNAPLNGTGDPQDLIIEVTVPPGPPCVGTIGDWVWIDNNSDGIQNSGDVGLNGVTVQLFNGATLVSTTVTMNAPLGYSPLPGFGPGPGSPGFYQFTGLCPGTYTVVVDSSQPALSGYLPTASNVGGNSALDSNGSPASVTLNNSTDETIDFGFVPAGPPSGNCVAITAVQGVAITPVTMVGSGGAGGPYTFIATGLPAGLTMSSGGTISGTPTVNGTFNYTVTVTDKAGNTGTVNCSVTVAPPPVSGTCVSITAVQGVPITPVTMTGSGGVGGPYTFTATGLPAGLTMSSGGTISGTPTVNGTFNYTVTVKDSAGNTGTVNCSVTVAPPPVSGTCVSITAVQGVPITPVTMTGSGGVGGPYTFTATGLPAGLTMSSGGTISGTPTVNGTFNYTVTVKDSAGNTGTVNCSVTVAPPVSGTCVSITAVQGVAITPVTMVGSGGAGGPYTFTATGLPAGLTMSSGGTISGTPTVNGTFNYTVTVTDSAGNTGTVNCSVTVAPPPSATCVSITAVQNVPLTPVTMTGSGGLGGPYTFSATGLPAGLTMSSGGTITGTPTVSGTFNYTVTVTDKAGNSGTVNCSVVVSPPPPPAQLVVTKTADSATVTAGSTIGYTVTISNTGATTATGLALTDPLPAGGNEFFNWTIDQGTGNPGSFTITGSAGSQTLAFSPAFLATDSLAPGQSISVHITTPTTVGDVSGGAVGLQAGVSSAAYLGTAGNYGVLYMVGSGTHNLSITNVTLGANIGVGSAVGGTGVGNVTFSGPGIVTGNLDFAPGQTNQFNNQNNSNVGPASVNTKRRGSGERHQHRDESQHRPRRAHRDVRRHQRHANHQRKRGDSPDGQWR